MSISESLFIGTFICTAISSGTLSVMLFVDCIGQVIEDKKHNCYDGDLNFMTIMIGIYSILDTICLTCFILMKAGL